MEKIRKKNSASKKKKVQPEGVASETKNVVVSETFERLSFLANNGIRELTEVLDELSLNELKRVLVGIIEHPLEESIKVLEDKEEIKKLPPRKQREIYATHMGRDLQIMKTHMAFERAKYDFDKKQQENDNGETGTEKATS